MLKIIVFFGKHLIQIRGYPSASSRADNYNKPIFIHEGKRKWLDFGCTSEGNHGASSMMALFVLTLAAVSPNSLTMGAGGGGVKQGKRILTSQPMGCGQCL